MKSNSVYLAIFETHKSNNKCHSLRILLQWMSHSLCLYYFFGEPFVEYHWHDSDRLLVWLIWRLVVYTNGIQNNHCRSSDIDNSKNPLCTRIVVGYIYIYNQSHPNSRRTINFWLTRICWQIKLHLSEWSLKICSIVANSRNRMLLLYPSTSWV